MARSVKARNRIDTKDRVNLAGRKNPYWQKLEKGLFAGYHRPLRGGAGTWWGRVMVEGKYRDKALVTADDHAAADGETILNWSQAQAAVRAWAAKQTAAGPLTIKQAVADYIANLRAEKGDRAAKDAEGRLNKRLIPVLGDVLLADLTTEQFQGWRNGLVKDEDEHDEEEVRQSRDTANRLLASAKAALNYAFNNGRVSDDKAWRRVKAFKNVGMPRQIILTEAEQQNFADACAADLREFALLVARTGARPGRELTEAKVRALDPAQKTLTVRGKTGEREIHLDPDALRQLRRLASGKRPDEYLLTTADGGQWTKSLHQRPVGAAVEKAGLDPATTLYTLRHTYISNSLKRGTPVDAVAKHCGTSISMIQKYYAKYIRSDLAKYAKNAAPKLSDEPAEKVAKLRVVA
jgi:site-specific recombinase XerD